MSIFVEPRIYKGDSRYYMFCGLTSADGKSVIIRSNCSGYVIVQVYSEKQFGEYCERMTELGFNCTALGMSRIIDFEETNNTLVDLTSKLIKEKPDRFKLSVEQVYKYLYAINKTHNIESKNGSKAFASTVKFLNLNNEQQIEPSPVTVSEQYNVWATW